MIETNCCKTDCCADESGPNSRPVSCDQVAWMLDAIRRYIPKPDEPVVSRKYAMMTYALLYEIMEAANLGFADADAIYNATPIDVRQYSMIPSSKSSRR